MLVKLLSRDIPEYEDVIKDTLDKTIPNIQAEMRLELYQELLLDQAQCWISTWDGKFEGVIISRISDDVVRGAKTFTIVGLYAFNKTTSGSFLSGYEELKKFALANDCKFLDMYTDNEEAIKYIRLFNIVWETKYFQLEI